MTSIALEEEMWLEILFKAKNFTVTYSLYIEKLWVC